MEQRQGEFRSLVTQAVERLLDEHEAEASCLLLICTQPSFDRWQSWAIFTSAQQDLLRVRKTIWDVPFDLQRFADPLAGQCFGWHTTPTLIQRTVSVPRATLAALFENVLLPLDAKEAGNPPDVDGETRRVRWRGMCDGNEWCWSRGRAPWRALDGWMDQLIQTLDTILL